MIKLAKSSSDIIDKGRELPEVTKIWRENARRIKKNYIWYIDRQNIPFYAFVLFISFIICLLSLFKIIPEGLDSILMSLACSFFAGIIVAAFLERTSNKRTCIVQVERFNMALCDVYSVIRGLTGHEYVGELVISNYALNQYAKKRGLNSLEGNNYFILINEVRELYKDIIDSIPFSHELVMAFVGKIGQYLSQIEEGINDFLANYSHLLEKDQVSVFKHILNMALSYHDGLNGIITHRFRANVESIDQVIRWAHGVVTDDIILKNYMQLTQCNQHNTNHRNGTELKRKI